jgi:Right handed beta helix region
MTRLTNTAGIAMLAAAAASLAAMGCIVEIGGGDGEAPERGAFAAGAATTAFHAVAPFRRLDTRGGSKLREGKARCLVLAGQDGIPVSVTAVVMNVAVVKPAKQGWLVAYPYGSKLPGTSTLNFAAGQVVANAAIVEVGGGGKVCFYAVASTDFIVDVVGYFGSKSGYVPLAPFRRISERGSKRPGSGATRCFQVAGRDGIPKDARAVALNLTAAAVTGSGYFTAYPKGAKRPTTSNLNYRPGGATANGALVAVGQGGEICVYVHTAAELIVDVTGYLAAASDYRAVTPFRRVDTRKGSPVLDGRTSCVTVVGKNGVPRGARAVAFNIAVTQPLSAGFVVVRPAGRAQTATSSLNFAAGETRANNGVVAVGDRGRICIYTRATTHYLLDIVGYWPDNGTSAAPLSHPRVYKVKSASALLNALETATSGDRVEVAPTASIDLSQHKEITIAAGVTITGGRSATQAGALIHSAKRDTLPWYRSWSLLRAAGAKITVRGVRLRGPDGTIDTHGQFVAYGVRATHDDFLIKGSELYNWPAAGVSVSGRNAVVRGNWIHDNIRVGRGYGVVVGKTKNAAVIEHNSFRRNRHAIAGSGHGSYIVRHNRFLASDAAGVHTLVDMHGVNEHTLDNSTQQAGVLIHVHNNDFEYVGAGHPIIGIRGIPAQLAVIENNCLASTRWTWITQSLMYAYPAPKSGMSCYQKASTWLCHTPRYGSAIQGITVRSNQLGRATGCR